MNTAAIIASLKKRYFAVLSAENYPHTPDLTKEADDIEKAIAELKKQSA